MIMKLRNMVALEIGRGLLSELAGKAAMNLARTIEMKVRHRAASAAPANAARRVLGIQPRDQAAEARLANLVHWSYGTLWGLARAALAPTRRAAPALHFAAVWGASLVALPALDVAPPI